MADECLAAVPEIEGIDYTLQEYLELLKHIQQVTIFDDTSKDVKIL